MKASKKKFQVLVYKRGNGTLIYKLQTRGLFGWNTVCRGDSDRVFSSMTDVNEEINRILSLEEELMHKYQTDGPIETRKLTEK